MVRSGSRDAWTFLVGRPLRKPSTSLKVRPMYEGGCQGICSRKHALKIRLSSSGKSARSSTRQPRCPETQISLHYDAHASRLVFVLQCPTDTVLSKNREEIPPQGAANVPIVIQGLLSELTGFLAPLTEGDDFACSIPALVAHTAACSSFSAEPQVP